MLYTHSKLLCNEQTEDRSVQNAIESTLNNSQKMNLGNRSRPNQGDIGSKTFSLAADKLSKVGHLWW